MRGKARRGAKWKAKERKRAMRNVVDAGEGIVVAGCSLRPWSPEVREAMAELGRAAAQRLKDGR